MGKDTETEKPGKSKFLEFQILDWHNHDERDEDDNDLENYVITLFGRTSDDKDVSLKIVDYEPHFFVKVPNDWVQHHVDFFITSLKRKISSICKNDPSNEIDMSKMFKAAKIERYYDATEFDNETLSKFVRLSFRSKAAFTMFANILAKPLVVSGISKNPILFKRYQSNLEPHLKFMHENDIAPCGWLKLKDYDLEDDKSYSTCNYSYTIDHKNVTPHPERATEMAPLKIMGYDIEVISEDEHFPQSRRPGDKVVQIGLTLYRYGSMECYEQHILTLHKCKPIRGAHLECHETEKSLFRGWARKIRELGPDVITGYYTTGFDDNYIYERIKRLDKLDAKAKGVNVEALTNKFEDEISEILGKLNNKEFVESGRAKCQTAFTVHNLSSSALGDNILSYYKIPGIVHIDMLKVIQKDHKLDGYKLDNVSATFINEKVTYTNTGKTEFSDEDINPDQIYKVSLFTPSTKALEVGSYVQIMIKDLYSQNPLKEHTKYPVTAVDSVKQITLDDGSTKPAKSQQIQIEMPGSDVLIMREAILEASEDKNLKIYWTFAKDDMPYHMISKGFNEQDPEIIRKSAKYCLKDCKLVNLLIAKLETMASHMAMANVCSVPFSYLFTRGQGVKAFSLLYKEAASMGYLFPVIRNNNKDATGDDEEGYEGATVINPKPGVYVSPVAVLDFNSLYPSSMMERNLSHESQVMNPKYDNLPGYIYHDINIVLKNDKGRIRRNPDGTPMTKHNRFAQKIVTQAHVDEVMKPFVQKGANDLAALETIIKADKVAFTDKLRIACKNVTKRMSYKEVMSDADKDALKAKLDMYNAKQYLDDIDKGYIIENQKHVNKTTYDIEWKKRFNNSKGHIVKYAILPRILAGLLGKRKETNARLAEEEDPFVAKILNCSQLAFKVTANSLYGQTGAKTSPMKRMEIAESTTCIGRECLHKAKAIIERELPGSEVIYGDTDSIFINFHIKDKNGNDRADKFALIETLKLAKIGAKIINDNMPRPQNIAYEKTFWPFVLITKKKYAGMKYENDPDSCYLAYMGIVLKRRDNAPIVKIVVGGILDHILRNRNVDMAIQYTKETLTKLMSGGYRMDKFITSKTLKAGYDGPAKPKGGGIGYSNPDAAAHVVLAKRMAIRDPGNKPSANDRIPYVFVVVDPKKKLRKNKSGGIIQGELVEHPDYVMNNNLKIDYLHYLERQIIIPASQILNLMISVRETENLFDTFVHAEKNKRIGAQSMAKWITIPQMYDRSSGTHSNAINKDGKIEISGGSMGHFTKGKKGVGQSMEKWLLQAASNKSSNKNEESDDMIDLEIEIDL
jgi:DNA polymerase elongation subunit (family B)